MSLRFRLTLFAALLVGVILFISGVTLRQGLESILRANLDRSLLEALSLARPLLNEENGHMRWEQEGVEAVRGLPGDLVLLYGQDRLVEVLGGSLSLTPSPREGCFTEGAWRFCGHKVGEGYLVAGRPLGGLKESLEALDRVLWGVGPGAFILALILGYILLGKALAPVHQLTLSAQQRARTQTFAPLPLPPARDELRTLAEAFNALMAALVAALDRERRFTQDAAHELRTPLTVLLGRLEQAREENRDPRLTPRLEAAHRSAQRLLSLVEELLRLARAEAGHGLRLDPVVLNEVARQVAEDLEPLFASKGIGLEVRLPPKPLVILGDEAALAMAVRNLLDNALKFSGKGAVRLYLYPEGQEAVLEVRDEGPGFPPEALPHLFKRFYQAKEEHRRLGSGLGLAIVAAVVRWHGGWVEAANAEPGARVVVRFPLASKEGG